MNDSEDTIGKAEPIGFTYLVTVADRMRLQTIVANDWFEQFRVYRMHYPEAALVNVQQITLRQAQDLED